MPILAQGYEPYRGSVDRDRGRIPSIAVAAIRRNLRWWTWLLFAISLIAGSGFWFFVVLVVYGGPAMIPGMEGRPPPFFLAITESPDFYPGMMDIQFFWALLMGTVVGAGEIAEDLRSGALVFYLGRPVTRRDYVLGKVAAVSTLVFSVTLVPALLLFALHAGFEGSWRWLVDHARIPAAALGIAAVEAVFISCLVLGVSALARRRRWATMAIAAVFLGLLLTSQIVAVRRDNASERERWSLQHRLESAGTPEEARALKRQIDESYDELGSISPWAGLRCLSPWASVTAAGRDLFGLPVPQNFSSGRHWLVLAVLSSGFGAVMLRRVRAVEIVT